MVVAVVNYTLDQAQRDIAQLRGQLAHQAASATFININVTGVITVEQPTILSLSGTWTATSGDDLTYQLLPDGHVHLSGEIIVGTGFSSPSTIATLPSGRRPARDECFPVAGFTTVPIVAMLRIQTTGVITVYGVLASTNTVRINGTFPLNGE